VPVIASNRSFWALAILTLGLPLAACTQATTLPAPAATTSVTSSAPSPATTTGGTAGTLQFDTVKTLTAERFTSDPNCAKGVWSENSTGIAEPHRGKSTTIQQYDCYKDEKAYLPTRGQQSLYVEFSDDADAAAYATSEATLYKSLQDGPRVVVVGIGLETVDQDAYLDDLQKSCGGCGVRRGSD